MRGGVLGHLVYNLHVPDDWSHEEVEPTVAAYLAMLELEQRGISFNKSDSRRRLRAMLNNRSHAAIERKHQNISAILLELGLPYVRGYKPLPNYQQLLYDVIHELVIHTPTLAAAIHARVEEPIAALPTPIVGLLDRLVKRPETIERLSFSRIADRPRKRPLANYLQLEASNRLLGSAGEEFVIRFESERLRIAGQRRLADKIEHVSRTRGDGDGYDICSFEASGHERLIEVKTTTFGPYTPFFVTRNEVDVSIERANQYYVYRLFDFRDDPKLFVVPGEISLSFTLEAIRFQAR